MTSIFTVKRALSASSYGRTAGFILCVLVWPCGFTSFRISLDARIGGNVAQIAGERVVIVITLFWAFKVYRTVYALAGMAIDDRGVLVLDLSYLGDQNLGVSAGVVLGVGNDVFSLNILE